MILKNIACLGRIKLLMDVFFTCMQKADRIMDQCVKELRWLSKKCGFGDLKASLTKLPGVTEITCPETGYYLSEIYLSVKLFRSVGPQIEGTGQRSGFGWRCCLCP